MPELDALVGELQRAVQDVIQPASQRNDQRSSFQTADLQAIIEAWYRWSQELFCDAVGLELGGPAFALAFCKYLVQFDQADFYLPPDRLRMSRHPVTALHVRFLTKRLREAGFTQVADELEDEWCVMGRAHRSRSDYHGFYDDVLEPEVLCTLDDMLVEAGPRSCTPDEARGEGSDADRDTIVRLINCGWQVYRADPSSYAEWEHQQVSRLWAAMT
jgi:hypothetical protein